MKKLTTLFIASIVYVIASYAQCAIAQENPVRIQEPPINTMGIGPIPTWYPLTSGVDPVGTTIRNRGETDTFKAPLNGPLCTKFVLIDLDSYLLGINTIVDTKIITTNIPPNGTVVIPSASVAPPPATFSWSPASNIDFLQLDVDPGNCFAEFDETNNTATRTLPDLTVTNVGVGGTWWGLQLFGRDVPSPAAGLPTTVSATTHNLGQMPATFHRISWTDEFPVGTVFSTYNYNDPAAPPAVLGMTESVGNHILDSGYIFANAGLHRVCVDADTEPVGTNGFVPESDETNNELCIDVQVHEPLAELTPWRSWRSGASRLDIILGPGSPSCLVQNQTYTLSTIAQNVGEIPTVNDFNV